MPPDYFMHSFFQARVNSENVETNGTFQVSLGNRDCNAFVDWNWDGKTLTVENDRYGFYPIYFLIKNNEITVSPSIAKILEFTSSIEFNENAFAVFLRLGWLIGEDTLFNSISALPPGSVLTWQNGKLKIDSQGILKSNKLEISRSEAIKTYAELFQKAIAKTSSENAKFAVPISGGRDSRHILFELKKQNMLPDACLTIIHPPPRPNEDARIAKLICERLRLSHHLIEQSSTRFNAEKRKNILAGFTVNEHGWFLALADFVKDNWNTIYDGIAGDVLSAGLFLTKKRISLFEAEKYEELAENILEPEGYNSALLNQSAYQRFSREKAVTHLCKELIRHTTQPNPVGSFYFWNRTRRCIAPSPFRLLGESVNVITPYLETDLFDFLASLPAHLLINHDFHTATISFAYPELADIPYEDKSSSQRFDTVNFRKYSSDIVKYSLSPRKRSLINRSFFLLRHFQSLIKSNYSREVVDFGELAVQLLQLERL